MHSKRIRFTRLGGALAVAGLTLAPAFAPSVARAQDESVLGALEVAYRHASELAAPSVVWVSVERPKERLRAGMPAYSVRPGTPASGILLEGGRIVTSNYHIDGATSVSVKFPDGTEQAARVLGTDGDADVAVLAVDEIPASARPFTAIRNGLPTVGTFAINVGRGPGGVTVNPGIVSARDRFRRRVHQVDGSINYGNLGGAVVDLDGRLLGMVAHVTGESGVNSGVGFMAAIDRIQANVELLAAGKQVPATKRPFLGVGFAKEHLDPPGIEVSQVMDGSAAGKAGLLKGDILEAFNGEPLQDWMSLSNAIDKLKPGDELKIRYRRGEARVEVVTTLGERPENE